MFLVRFGEKGGRLSAFFNAFIFAIMQLKHPQTEHLLILSKNHYKNLKI